jgi:hypothetical protein
MGRDDQVDKTRLAAHWQAMVNTTEALAFNRYLRFMESIFTGDRSLPLAGNDAYRVLQVATEAFVMVNCGVMGPLRTLDGGSDRDDLAGSDLSFPTNGLDAVFAEAGLARIPGGESLLPYLAVIRTKLPGLDVKLTPFEPTADQLSACYGILQKKLAHPCLLELIWSYWHEEGMLVQTVNAVGTRFRSVRGALLQDPLARLEVDPLRPLSNLLWGFVQDEQRRLSVARRNYEYDHHYGLRLEGPAVRPTTRMDTRSKFPGAFHDLLRLCTTFYKQDDDTTLKADAVPTLNALREVHLMLAEGQHNQFGDLTSTARIEMLVQQWLLARPELREFLPNGASVAYPELWMGRVEAMKTLQGWTDTSVLHFRNLGVFGEQILLGIRWGFRSDVQPSQAANWARFFRPQIQGYVHAYQAVAGIQL